MRPKERPEVTPGARPTLIYTSALSESNYFGADGKICFWFHDFMDAFEGRTVSQARAYLDHNATTPLRPVAREAMLAALTTVGNASSVHAEGRAARSRIETAD